MTSQTKQDAHTPSLFDLEHELALTCEEYIRVSAELEADKELSEDSSYAVHLTQKLITLERVVQAYVQGAKDKRDKVAAYIRYLQGQSKLAAEEIRRLQQYKKARENAAAQIKNYLVLIMKGLGLQRLEGNHTLLYLRRLKDAVDIDNPDAVPRSYCKKEVVYKPDREKIAKALAAGKKVAGCELVTDRSTVQIR